MSPSRDSGGSAAELAFERRHWTKITEVPYAVRAERRAAVDLGEFHSRLRKPQQRILKQSREAQLILETNSALACRQCANQCFAVWLILSDVELRSVLKSATVLPMQMAGGFRPPPRSGGGGGAQLKIAQSGVIGEPSSMA